MFLIDDDSLPESETLIHFFFVIQKDFGKAKKIFKKEENMKKEKKTQNKTISPYCIRHSLHI